MQTLVFGWMRQPDATLEAPHHQAALQGRPSRRRGCEALSEPKAAECLKCLAAEAVGVLLETTAAAIPLLRRFRRVSVEDCTVVLPARLASQQGGGGDDAQGQPGGPEEHGRMDLKKGRDRRPSRGQQPDVTAGQEAPPLPAGSLRRRIALLHLDMAARVSRTARRATPAAQRARREATAAEPPRRSCSGRSRTRWTWGCAWARRGVDVPADGVRCPKRCGKSGCGTANGAARRPAGEAASEWCAGRC